MDFLLYLTVNKEKYICANELYEKLIICRIMVEEPATPIVLLSFLKKHVEAFLTYISHSE
jgi:hypothetical protein